MSTKAKILKKAEFNPRLKTYFLVYGIFMFLITIVGIPFVLFWVLIAPVFINKYFDRLECELTTRSLRFKKGFLVQVEKTIPLDKIQDLTFKEGPLLKWLGLSILRIETAGNSGAGVADLSLIGIVDAHVFRQMVFDQRDLVTDNKSVSHSNTDENSIEVLKEIRDIMLRIDQKLNQS
ncbi:MAG TPA: hypothetical protein DEQ34_08730 [Balneolaceae bacterium]|nr:hypothetical protein [Balneolaceae bacterium]|tara:strand:- start:107094 stop:107627 length:534 start_codon:yes stop_codon:yes gene_type:complete